DGAWCRSHIAVRAAVPDPAHPTLAGDLGLNRLPDSRGRDDRGNLRHPHRPVSHDPRLLLDRKSTRLNSSHQIISYAVFCLKKKNKTRKSKLESEQHIKV